MSKVRVVDSIMGSGKTTWAINRMNANPELSYVFITPFLSECERIQKACPGLNFVQPEENPTKIESFCSLLSQGRNIVTTHALFTDLKLSRTVEKYISNYIFILDETVDTFEPIGGFSKAEIKMTIDSGLAKKSKNGYYKWIAEDTVQVTAFSRLKQMAQRKTLIWTDNCFLVWYFPIDFFLFPAETYILTFIFEGSQMYSTFTSPEKSSSKKKLSNPKKSSSGIKTIKKTHAVDFNFLFNMEQDILSSMDHEVFHNKQEIAHAVDFEVFHIENGKLIKGEQKLTEEKKYLREHIHIFDNYNEVGEDYFSLSASKWKSAKKEDREMRMQVLKNARSFFEYRCKAHAKDCMWACFKNKDKKNSCTVNNYTSAFVPFNTKATNQYRDRKYLAYLVNVFPHSEIFEWGRRNGIHIDPNQYALSVMLQWIWRSAIRDGEDIILYLPSRRMREILLKWLK